jgi:hypothetical protein
MRNLAGPSFECVNIFFSCSGNNWKRGVYCLRARKGVASAARWSSDVLPYLGPEIIAVMQAALNSAPNDSRSGPSPAVPQNRRPNQSVDGLVVQSEVLQFEDCKSPQCLGPLAPLMRSRPDTAAGFGPVGNLLAFIGMHSIRDRIGRHHSVVGVAGNGSGRPRLAVQLFNGRAGPQSNLLSGVGDSIHKHTLIVSEPTEAPPTPILRN